MIEDNKKYRIAELERQKISQKMNYNLQQMLKEL